MTENEAIELLNASYIVDWAGDVDRRRIKLEEFLISAPGEVQKYRQIGTVEECREAVEKQNYMKIKTIEDMCFECPKCKELVAHDDGWNTYNYCPNCGQKLSGIE